MLSTFPETAMGVSINAQKHEKSDYVSSVKEMSRIIAERFLSPFKRVGLFFSFSSDNYRQTQALKVLHSFTYSVIDSKLEKLKASSRNLTKEDDFGVKKKMAFLDILLQAKENDQPLSRESIREEVDTFMFEV